MGSGAGADRGELHPYQDHRQGHPSEHCVVSVRAHVPGNANNKRLSPTSIRLMALHVADSQTRL